MTKVVSLYGEFGQNLSKIWAKFGKKLGNIWPKFGRNLGEIWAKHGRNLGEIWARFGQDLGKSPKFRLNFAQISRFAQILPKFCPNYTQILPESCPNFAQFLPKSCPKFALNLPNSPSAIILAGIDSQIVRDLIYVRCFGLEKLRNKSKLSSPSTCRKSQRKPSKSKNSSHPLLKNLNLPDFSENVELVSLAALGQIHHEILLTTVKDNDIINLFQGLKLLIQHSSLDTLKLMYNKYLANLISIQKFAMHELSKRMHTDLKSEKKRRCTVV